MKQQPFSVQLLRNSIPSLTELLCGGLTILSASALQAAPITWGTVNVVSGDTDVSTVGAFDRAHIFSGGSTTVNGVTFSSFAASGDGQTNMGPLYGGFGEGAPFNTLSASYQTLLTNGTYGAAGNGTITLNNTNVGLDYQVQFWVNDSRTCCSGRNETVSGSGALAYSTNPGGSGGVGSYVTGSFTADGISQVLNLSSPTSLQANGLQLRATGVSAGNTATITNPRNWTALTTGAGSTIKYDLAADATQATVVSGSGDFVKTGTGVLTLTEAQTYTGATMITGGTLRLQGAATGAVAGAARQFDASNLGLADGTSVTQWNDLSGTGANATVPSGNSAPTYVANAGTGTGLGALSFTAGTSAVDSQSLTFTQDNAVRSVFSIFKGSAFLLTDSGNYAFHRPTDTNPADPLIANYGGQTPNIVAGATYVNGVAVNPTSTAMPTATNNGFNQITMLTNGSPVSVNGFNKDRIFHSGNQFQAEVLLYDFVVTEEQRLHNEAYLQKKWFGTDAAGFGDGALPATTAVSISNGGILDVNNSDQTIGSLSSTDGLGSQVLLSAGSLKLGDATNQTFDGIISGSGAVTKQGVGTWTLTGANTYTGLTTVAAGRLRLGNGTTDGAIAGDVLNNGVTEFSNVNAAVVGGKISGTGSLEKTGTGTLTLNGANSYAGNTLIAAGTLIAGSDSALGASGGAISVQSGASLDINGRTLQGYTQNISIAGAGTSPTLGALGNGGGGNLNAIRGITLTGNASIGGDAGRWDIGRLDFVADVNNTVDHIDGGGFVLTKVGSGAIGLLTGATNLAGFIMNGGLIQPHENTAFGAGPVTLNAGTIQPWGATTMVNNFTINGGTMQTEGFNDTYSGTFALNGASTFNTPGGSITLNGNVSGIADVLKIGGGTLVFNGNNSQTGKLTVAGGHVRFGSTTGQATLGNVEMTNAGSFLIMAAPNQFGPTSTLKFNSPGHSEFALYGHNQTIASLESANQFAVVQNSHGGFGAAAANSTLTVNQNTDTTYSGYVRNNTGNDAFNLSLTKTGTGRLTLEGTNITYTGATNISGGTLRVSGTATGSAYSINNGGTLEGTGSIVTTNQNVTLNAGGKLSPGASPGTLTINVGSGQLDLTGGIAGSSTNALLWEIDSNPAATDLINLTGTLNIGAGLLEWDDFAFTSGSLSNGIITLIDSDLAISGSLGANVSGALPGGYTGTLSLGDSNTSLIMTVVPEPTSILLATLAGLGLLRRRRV